MTETVKRYNLRQNIPATATTFLPDVVVSASDYERLEQECERLRLDNLSKNGSIKAFGAQIAALQRAVKNRDKLKARAESERDAALAECERLRALLRSAQWCMQTTPSCQSGIVDICGCKKCVHPRIDAALSPKP